MANLSISMFFLLASSIGFVLSNPLIDGYKNLPQCLQPEVSGLCLAYFPRYYYDSNTDSCKSFVYGGCRGNENNFITEEECLAKCKGFKPETTDFKLITESDAVEERSADQEQPPVDPCTLPSDTGDCRAAFPRLFYNAATSKCEQFIYGGCNGNANNFKTIEECQQRCESGSNSASEDSPKVDEPEAESAAKNE